MNNLSLRVRLKATPSRRPSATVLAFSGALSAHFGSLVSVLFFRHHFWERLMANFGIVLVFAAFALRFLRRSP